MNVFEMMRTGEVHPLLFMVIIKAIALGCLCFMLAKSKNRNYRLAFLAGAFPVINFFAILYYIGVPKLERSSSKPG